MVSTLEAVRARQAERHGEKLLYAAKMNLAQAAWEQNRVPDVRRLLRETAAYPGRGFEWHYWQRQTHLELKTLRHLAPVWAVAFSPDGRDILTGSTDGTAKVWDAVSGEELFPLSGHSDCICSVSFSPDGRRILTSSEDTTARIWDAATGKELLLLNDHNGTVYVAAFSADSRRVVTCSWDKTAKVWDAATGKVLLTFTNHAGPVVAVAFSPDGQQIATCSEDATAKIWEAASGNVLVTLPTGSESSPRVTIGLPRCGKRLPARNCSPSQGMATKSMMRPFLLTASGLSPLVMIGLPGSGRLPRVRGR